MSAGQKTERNGSFSLSAQRSTAPTTQRLQPGKQEATTQSGVWTQHLPDQKTPKIVQHDTHSSQDDSGGLLGQVQLAPAEVLGGGEGGGLREVGMLEVARPQVGLHRLLAHVLQRHLGLRPHVLQGHLRLHIEAQRLHQHAHHAAQQLGGEADDLWRQSGRERYKGCGVKRIHCRGCSGSVMTAVVIASQSPVESDMVTFWQQLWQEVNHL